MAAADYRDWVAQADASDWRMSDAIVHAIYLGREAWAKTLRLWVESKPRSVSGMIYAAEREFGRDRSMLATLDASLALLRA